jgi:hypothetical protein
VVLGFAHNVNAAQEVPMSSSTALQSSVSTSAADAALAEILTEISVPMAVLEEAKRRRELAPRTRRLRTPTAASS